MTALTKGRDTKRVEETSITLPVAAGVTIYEGAIVVLNLGYAAPGASIHSAVAIGRADETVVGGVTDGAVKVKVSKGAFWYANSHVHPLTLNHLNQNCYVVDDQTVGALVSDAFAGRVVNVDATKGVCVELGKPSFVYE